MQPKIEPGSPSNHKNLNNNASIRDLVSVLRTAYKTEDFDRVEEILVSSDMRLKTEIGTLQEKLEMEKLTILLLEEQVKNREKDLSEKWKKAQERYELLLKEVKMSVGVGVGVVAELRKKNSELESEVCELRKLREEEKADYVNAISELRKKNGVLEWEICGLRKFKEKSDDDDNVINELRKKIDALEFQVWKLEECFIDNDSTMEFDSLPKNGEDNHVVPDDTCTQPPSKGASDCEERTFVMDRKRGRLESDLNGNGSTKESQPIVKTRLCNKFNTAEGCKFGDKCRYAHSTIFGASTTAKITINACLVGPIIGKNGANSKKICCSTGVAKFSIGEHDSDPNLRSIELQGSVDQIKQASAMVQDLIQKTCASERKSKTQLCRDFAKGSCNFGERCRYVHGTDEPSNHGM